MWNLSSFNILSWIVQVTNTMFVWHPKFYLTFSNSYLVWGRWFKFFLLKNSPSQIKFFLWQVFCFGFTPRLDFGLGGSFFLFGLKPKCFSLEKNVFWNCPMAFGMILFHFQKSLLPWPKCKSTLISLSSSLDHDVLQIQLVEPLHIFISIYFLSKTISAFYLDPWRFSKELPFLLWILPPNQFP